MKMGTDEFNKRVAEAMGWTGLRQNPSKAWRDWSIRDSPVMYSPGEWIGHSPMNPQMETVVFNFSGSIEYALMVWRRVLEIDPTAIIGGDYIGLKQDNMGPRHLIQFNFNYIPNLAKAICDALLYLVGESKDPRIQGE